VPLSANARFGNTMLSVNMVKIRLGFNRSRLVKSALVSYI
jgi:hypothetical protein